MSHLHTHKIPSPSALFILLSPFLFLSLSFLSLFHTMVAESIEYGQLGCDRLIDTSIAIPHDHELRTRVHTKHRSTERTRSGSAWEREREREREREKRT
jgi:hypothetical protein